MAESCTPWIVLDSFWSDMPHNLMSPELKPTAAMLSLLLASTLLAIDVAPGNFLSLEVVKSQILTVLSEPQLRTRVPPVLKTHEFTTSLWPSSNDFEMDKGFLVVPTILSEKLSWGPVGAITIAVPFSLNEMQDGGVLSARKLIFSRESPRSHIFTVPSDPPVATFFAQKATHVAPSSWALNLLTISVGKESKLTLLLPIRD